MVILIDYDNLGRYKRRGLLQNIRVLLDKIPSSNLIPGETINCRLYGGWLGKKGRFTQNAQDLLRKIDADFPGRISVSGRKIMIQKPELATSLACDRGKDFPNTYRIRSSLPKVRRFPLRGCIEPDNCSITAIKSFVYEQTCVQSSCDVSPEQAFFRAEQKMVDSMIVVDMIDFATRQQEPLIVVSGDDDMWPGIRYVLLNDIEITHVIPRSSSRNGQPYRHLYTPRYTSVIL